MLGLDLVFFGIVPPPPTDLSALPLFGVGGDSDFFILLWCCHRERRADDGFPHGLSRPSLDDQGRVLDLHEGEEKNVCVYWLLEISSRYLCPV